MPDYFHVSGQNWDEIHEAPLIVGDPSRLVTTILTAGNAQRKADIAQAIAEALNAVDIFEANLAGLPGPARTRVTAALAKVRIVARP